MPGLSTRGANAVANGVSSQPATAWPTAMFLALFTAVGKDNGTGFTEVTGGSYARVQISGNLIIGTTQGALGTTLTFASVPSWITPGMSVTNTTRADIPANTSVISTTATTVVISTSTVGTVATSGDNIVFSAFNAPFNGEPSVMLNSANITFPVSTGSWGTVIAWGLYDALTVGNLWVWDFLGGYAWKHAYITSASPAVWTTLGHGYFVGDTIVYCNEIIGNLPTFTTGSFTVTGDSGSGVSPLLTILGVTGSDTYTVQNGVTTIATSSTGDGMIRKVVTQPIPASTVFAFGANTFIVTII